MTGTTNQIQTPLGTGVQADLANAVDTAGGLSVIPDNPNVAVTGTVYGPLFTVWDAASTAAGGYSPIIIATYNNVAANGVGQGFPSITTINFGSIQQLNNGFSGAIPTITSIVASSFTSVLG